MRRVVITGLGMVSPLACGAEESWKRLTAGQNAAKRIDNFEVEDLSCQIACQIARWTARVERAMSAGTAARERSGGTSWSTCFVARAISSSSKSSFNIFSWMAS